MVWIIECKATDSLHKTCGNDTSLPSKQKKYLTREHWTLKHAKTTVNRKKIEQKVRPSIMFDPCVIPEHHKQKPPDAETGKNRSFPRQPQIGVELILRWCKSWSAEQPTIYRRHTAMTQVFHRSRKKYLTRKHCTLQLAKTIVNQKQCPSKNSPFNNVWPMCYSQTSQA